MTFSFTPQENIYLAPLTSFKIGGPAQYFYQIKNGQNFISALTWVKKKKIPLHILSGGTNVLISDQGVKGLVIFIKNNNIIAKGRRIIADAGTDLALAVSLAKSLSLSGLEWAVGIPGSIGGAVRGNAGAFGHDISEVVETITVLDINSGQFKILSRNDCHFSYRQSLIKEKKNYIILQITLKLIFADTATISNLMEKNLQHRLKTQPRLPSAGSVFKNIDADFVQTTNFDLYNRAKSKQVIKANKIPAGWLISELGLKGKTIGGAKISLEHGNFIVNTGKATAEDVITMISYIKQQVRDKFGLQLNEEIEFLGFS